jgi:hypothetical protein
MSTGHISFDELAAIVETGVPVMHIVKPYQDEEFVLVTSRRRSGSVSVAVGMDVDAMFGEKAVGERGVPGPEELGLRRLEQIRGFCGATKLPFVVKGVLSELRRRHPPARSALPA